MPSFSVICSIGPALRIGSFWVVIRKPFVVNDAGAGAAEVAGTEAWEMDDDPLTPLTAAILTILDD